MMDGMLSTYLEQVKDRVNSCEEFYELQQQQWQESIQLRTEEGIVKTIAGVGTMILGGILIVATCGMALPLVATVGVAAIGLGTAAYGCTNAVEGGQDVYAGVTGDPRMVSVNPIRDTLFASNPELYYLIRKCVDNRCFPDTDRRNGSKCSSKCRNIHRQGSSDRVCQAWTDGGSQQLCGKEHDRSHQQSTGRLFNRFADWNSNIWNAQ